MEKRIELHTHTKYSLDRDSVIDIKDLMETALKDGNKGVALTDYNFITSFPKAEKILKEMNVKNFKLIYGVELDINLNDKILKTIILVKNQKGLKNLYKIINILNKSNENKIDIKELLKFKEDLIFGLSINKQVFIDFKESNLTYLNYFDYFEIEPVNNYSNLFKDELELKENIKNIIKFIKNKGLLVTASSNPNYLYETQKLSKQVLYTYYNKTEQKYNRFKTTREMLEEFDFLEENIKYDIVINNPNKIINQIEEVKISNDKPLLPKLENKHILKKQVYEQVYKLYGNNLPNLIKQRLEEELKIIEKRNYEYIFMLYKDITDFLKEKEWVYMISSPINNSFVAYLLGITHINPLPVHYRCCKCKRVVFDEGECCKVGMLKDGYNLSLLPLFGIDGEKMPKIAFKIPNNCRFEVHHFLDQHLQKHQRLRCLYISTINKIVLNKRLIPTYEDKMNYKFNENELEQLNKDLIGVAMYPECSEFNEIVIPDDVDILDVTSFHYGPGLKNSNIKYPDYDYHDINDNLLNISFSSRYDLGALTEIQRLTNLKISEIPLNDEKVMSLFYSCDALNVKPEDIMRETSLLGLGAFDTPWCEKILSKLKPKTIFDLEKLFWYRNTDEILENKLNYTYSDILNILINHNINLNKAYEIMNFITKNNKTLEETNKYKGILKEHNISKEFIDNLNNFRYIFGESYNLEISMITYFLAYYKLYFPLEFYLGYIKSEEYDLDYNIITSDYESIKKRYLELNDVDIEKDTIIPEKLDTKEFWEKEILKLALEMKARNIHFKIEKVSLLDDFTLELDKENNTIIIYRNEENYE